MQIEAPFAGNYSGRFQDASPGSYVEIASNAALDRLRSFNVQAMVHPTLLPRGVRARHGGLANSSEEPGFQDQHLVSRWNNQAREGWALLIERNGQPAFMIGDGHAVHRTSLDRTLFQDRWFLITGGFDAEHCTVRIAATPVACSAGDQLAWSPQCQEERC